MRPARHLPCGRETEVRWVIADDGVETMVFWCPTCDDVPTNDQLSRPIDLTDVTGEVLLRLSTPPGRVQ